MRLNGIHGEPGDIVGRDHDTDRLLAVESCDNEGVVLRFATQEDVSRIRGREPRTMAEHYTIKPRLSPYGMIRQWNRIPQRLTPIKVEVPLDSRPRWMRRGQK